MANFPLKSEETEASEITAVCDYLEQLPLDLWGPKHPLLDLLCHYFFGWFKSQLWDLTAIHECTLHASHLAELASPDTLSFLSAKFEFENDIEMANYERVMNCYKNLVVVALVGALALRWYEPNLTGFSYSMVQIGVGGITTFIVLLSVFVAYLTNASMRATNCYRKYAHLLSLAQILAN